MNIFQNSKTVDGRLWIFPVGSPCSVLHTALQFNNYIVDGLWLDTATKTDREIQDGRIVITNGNDNTIDFKEKLIGGGSLFMRSFIKPTDLKNDTRMIIYTCGTRNPDEKGFEVYISSITLTIWFRISDGVTLFEQDTHLKVIQSELKEVYIFFGGLINGLLQIKYGDLSFTRLVPMVWVGESTYEAHMGGTPDLKSLFKGEIHSIALRQGVSFRVYYLEETKGEIHFSNVKGFEAHVTGYTETGYHVPSTEKEIYYINSSEKGLQVANEKGYGLSSVLEGVIIPLNENKEPVIPCEIVFTGATKYPIKVGGFGGVVFNGEDNVINMGVVLKNVLGNSFYSAAIIQKKVNGRIDLVQGLDGYSLNPYYKISASDTELLVKCRTGGSRNSSIQHIIPFKAPYSDKYIIHVYDKVSNFSRVYIDGLLADELDISQMEDWGTVVRRYGIGAFVGTIAEGTNFSSLIMSMSAFGVSQLPSLEALSNPSALKNPVDGYLIPFIPRPDNVFYDVNSNTKHIAAGAPMQAAKTSGLGYLGNEGYGVKASRVVDIASLTLSNESITRPIINTLSFDGLNAGAIVAYGKYDIELGKVYLMKCTITNYEKGYIKMCAGNYGFSNNIDENGNYESIVTTVHPLTNCFLYIFGYPNFKGDVSNISIQELTKYPVSQLNQDYDVEGNLLTHPPIKNNAGQIVGFNNPETTLEQFPSPALRAAPNSEFWFNPDGSTKTRTVSELLPNVQDAEFTHVVSEKEVRSHVLYKEPQNQTTITQIEACQTKSLTK